MTPRSRRGMTISLEFLLGIIISLMLILGGCTIIAKLTRLTQDSAESFDELVNLINKVSGQNSGSIGSMSLRMDKETFIIGFPKSDEAMTATTTLGSPASGQTNIETSFQKPLDCETGMSCLCLCREVNQKIEGEFDGFSVICKEGKLICKSFDDTVALRGPFVISRSEFFYNQIKDVGLIKTYLEEEYNDDQFRAVFVENYRNSVAVCEQRDKIEDGSQDDSEFSSCVTAEEREQEKAIEGLKALKTFIELCKLKRSSDGKPCSCGTFDMKLYFPEGYTLSLERISEGETAGNLRLNLIHASETVSHVDVETGFCTRAVTHTGEMEYDPDSVKNNCIIEDESLPGPLALDPAEKKDPNGNNFLFYKGAYNVNPSETNPSFCSEMNVENPLLLFIRESSSSICSAYLPYPLDACLINEENRQNLIIYNPTRLDIGGCTIPDCISSGIH